MNAATVHTCRTTECWHEHATDERGWSRCLRTPKQWPWGAERGSLFCSKVSVHDGPCRYDLRIGIRRTWRRASATLVGAVVGMLGALVLAVIR